MNTELYIARRLLKGKKNKQNYSRPIVNIAVAGIALGLIVMIIAVSVLTGFKQEISNKVSGFGSHIQVTNYDSSSSYETQPITENQDWLDEVRKLDHVTHIQRYITKAGIIKTESCLEGVMLKGVDTDFDWSFFKTYLTEGDIPHITDSATYNDVLISENLARRLKLNTGDDLRMYFIQDPPRMRKFEISGIYNTQLEELDKVFIFVDIKHLRKLNNWDENQISGFEILIDDFDYLFETDMAVTRIVGNNYSPDLESLRVKNITAQYPQIFDWLNLQDTNMWVILILMVVVAGFNMVSGLLIIILERTNMIGILKSMGTTNFSIRKVFLYHAGFLISRGLLWGNLLGIGLCLLQQQFGLIKLDPESYYVSMVPINLNVLHLLVLNAATMLVTILMLIVPSMLVTRISPSDAIKFK
ncbi:MAG: ABC transporter permease [Candidatus Delongbacteria bacterium]|jgi:lipoprotein-releasing system permease protein|nr:ABC transporter permease [Candidatus Delongbacteria bacterium]